MNKWTAVVISFFMTGCIHAETQVDKSTVNLCEILQLTINLPGLQQYYHINEKPQRKPLRLLLSYPQLNCQYLEKFGSQVIINKTINKQLPYLQINKIKIKQNTAKVEFEYKEEGIKGIADFKMNNKQWSIVSEKIVEM